MTSATTAVLVALLVLGLPAGRAAAQPPADAVAGAVQSATSNGVASYVSVVDRNSGAVLTQTGNAGAQVASESIMKLFLAAYYLRLYGGQSSTPQSVKDRLAYMLMYSDDATASSLFTASAIPTIADIYGLGSTSNATDRVGHWGAARITAADMTTFLFRAMHDDQVGPWLLPVMAQTQPTGSGEDAAFRQDFGLNALGGDHGSKQGWGCDSFWTNPPCAVHSVGYTDRYFVAILQLSNGYPDPMRGTSTATARAVQASSTALVDGDFICDQGTGAVYRMAGGAPVYVSTWAAFGGPQAYRLLSSDDVARLPRYPADGTFLRGTTTGAIYRIAGGAPVYVSRSDAVGGIPSFVNVDEAAIDQAGSGWYSHLAYRPADGTFIRASDSGAVYIMAGGAPIYVSTWAAYPGPQSVTTVDEAAIDRAGSNNFYSHIADKPADGTLLHANATGAVYQIAGGAPVYVSSFTRFGGVPPFVNVEEVAINQAGSGWYSHLAYRPADGTFLRAWGSGAVYRMAGGAPVYVSTWAGYGGEQPATTVDAAAVDRAGSNNFYSHIADKPADGTFIRGTTTGAVYRIAGGGPVYVSSSEAIGGIPSFVNVDEAAIDQAGSGWYSHLLFYPADGTFLQGRPGLRIYRVAGGIASYVPSWAPYGGQQPFTVTTQQTMDLAGTGLYRHLRG